MPLIVVAYSIPSSYDLVAPLIALLGKKLVNATTVDSSPYHTTMLLSVTELVESFDLPGLRANWERLLVADTLPAIIEHVRDTLQRPVGRRCSDCGLCIEEIDGPGLYNCPACTNLHIVD